MIEVHSVISMKPSLEVSPVVSTSGGPGKTTVGANLGAFCADAVARINGDGERLIIDAAAWPRSNPGKDHVIRKYSAYTAYFTNIRQARPVGLIRSC